MSRANQSPEELIQAWLTEALSRPVAPDEDLMVSGELDSLQTMELVAWLEERFNVRIDAADLTAENLSTQQRIAKLITRLRN